MNRASLRGVSVRGALLILVAFLAWSLMRPVPLAAQAPGELSGRLPTNGGLAIVFWGGGDIDAVGWAAQAGGCDAISTWTTHEGEFIGYIFGAPEFVNAGFLVALPGGEISASTGLIVVCRGDGAPSAPASLTAPNLSDYLPSAAEIEAYRAAVGLRDAGKHQEAALAFAEIGAASGPMAPMAKLRAGQMLLLAEQHEAAATALAQAVADPGLPPALRIVGRIDAATALVRLERSSEALTMLESVTAANGASSSQVAYALWNRAQILRDQGNSSWVDLARSAVSNYPHTPYARNALIALEDAGVTVPTLEAAYVRYQRHEDATARSLYQQVASGGSGSDAATAWFYIGAIDERADKTEDAIAAYEQSIALAPGGGLADDAHWWAAVLLVNSDIAAAAAHYEAIASSMPDSPFASDAGVRAALMRFELGSPDAAISGLTALMNNSSGYTAARAARWIRVLGGDAPSPANFQPLSIAAILDAAGADADQPLPAAALSEGIATGDPDWGEAATWMQTRFGSAPGAPLSLDQNLLRLAFGLNAADEEAVARTVLYGYMSTLGERPYATLELSRLASAAGMYDISISAAERLLAPLLSSERLESPAAIEQLSFPTPYAQEILDAAQAEGVPPLLLAALARRESMFRADIVSSAGARGLTQVMPDTGQAIASSLGMNWDVQMLLDPATSLRFGAHYLATQLESFDGDVFGALAAYNGGPGNASRWYDEQLQPGADWYIETVDFSETRNYLRLVVEDYAWYRYVYGHASAPTMR